MDVVGEPMFGLAEAQEKRAEVLGVDVIGHKVSGVGLGEGLELGAGTLAGLVERFGVGEDGLGLGSKDE